MWPGKTSDTIQFDVIVMINQPSFRKLETYFLQKRFTIYNHKPEMILKEDTGELKQELVRLQVHFSI